MLRWTLLFSTLLFVHHASATNLPDRLFTEGQAPCINCLNSLSNTSNDSLKRFASQVKSITVKSVPQNTMPEPVLDIEFISDKMNYNNKCDKFSSDGELNKWGALISEELGKPKYSTLLNEGPKDMEIYCPNYKNMAIKEKKTLNILILTAMAHYESSCNFREKATGPNGTAAGLLQLHQGREQRYSSGCRKGDSKSPERSLVCGLSMINDQIGRGENLFSSRSYWDVLRPGGRSRKAKLIMKAIRKFTPCAETSESTVGGNSMNLPDVG